MRAFRHRWLVTLVAVGAGLLGPAHAGPVEDAWAIVERWLAAFSASDVDAIVALYAADATFIGTSSRAVVAAPEGVRRYFERSLLNNRPRSARLGEHVIVPLSADEVLVTGLDTLTGVRDGVAFSTHGRVTFVIARRGEDWHIVHFHRSALPD